MGCCDETIELGSPGSNGANGISCYLYIAFADDVTSGSPDVVTGFSLDVPTATSEWIAFLKSNTPIASPVEADFEDLWTKYKGADGAGSAGINVKVNNSTVSGGPFTTLDFLGAGLSGITGANAGSGEVDITIVTAGLITLTRAQALTLIGTNQLVPGGTYYIYDVGDGVGLSSGYGGVILRAITTSSFALDGVFLARIPKRSTINQWSHIPSYAVGDKVEDFNEVYIANTITTPGELPCLETEFTFVTKDSADYESEINGCQYDITRNAFIKRWDNRGNVITLTNLPSVDNQNEIILQCFRWGTNDVEGNNITIDRAGLSGGWSTGRLPSLFEFNPTYIQGEFKSNIIRISGSERFIPDYDPITFYFRLQACDIKDNIINRPDIIYKDDCLIVGNELNDCSGTFPFTLTYSKVSLSSFTGNDSDCTFVNNDISNSAITSNTNLQVISSKLHTNTITNNNTVAINTNSFNFIFSGLADIQVTNVCGENSTISDCSTLVSSDTSGFAKLTLINSTISDIVFNSELIIGKGVIKNATLSNIVVDNTVTRTTTNVLGAAKTLKQIVNSNAGYALVNFSISDVSINGGDLTYAITAPTVDFLPYTNDGVDLSSDSSSFTAYVDGATAISGTTLTLPIWAEHAGIIMVYNAPAASPINTLALASGVGSANYKGTRRIYKFSDAGTLGVTAVAIATPPTANQIIGTAGTITLTRPYDFVELRKSGSFYTLENSKIVT